MLSIEATANSPEVAQDAAEDMAEAFRADVNSIKQRGTEEHVAELQRQLGEVAPLAPDGSANPYFASLQDRIDAVAVQLERSSFRSSSPAPASPRTRRKSRRSSCWGPRVD